MRQIIHNYKLRLTNLSQANRSLRLGRLSARRDIDLFQLGHLHQLSADEILERIISGKDVRLINKIDPRHEPTNLAERRLNNIYRELNTLFEETGNYDLFVGYPFVEGKFLDGSIARCPVLLFPVKLIRNLKGSPRWKLEQLKEEGVIFNPTFFMAYEKFQQQRFEQTFWEEEIAYQPDWLAWIESLYQKIKSYDIQVNFNSQLFVRQLRPFKDYLKATMDHFQTGSLIFQPEAVLGIFPQSDSGLLQDYETIEIDPPRFQLSRIFEDAGSLATENPNQEAAYVREEDRFFVAPVDQSQEAALLKIKNGNSLLVHGPPGTGKSQLIVNAISDAIAHGKKVLLVSQKRAALDVVYKRLNSLGLGRYAILVHDYRHDRKQIFRQIKQQIDDIPLFEREVNDLNITRVEHEFQMLSRQLDQLNKKFETLFDGLTHRAYKGISIHELYLQTPIPDPLLPLKEIADQWDKMGMEQGLEEIGNALDYRELLTDTHPWADRLSFADYHHGDQQRLAELLQQIPSHLTQLNLKYAALKVHIADDILDPAINQQRIDQIIEIDQWISDEMTLKAWEEIRLDDRSPSEVLKSFQHLAVLLDKLDRRTLIDDGYWRLFGSLLKHQAAYQKFRGASLKWLSIPFIRARWFWKKVLGEKGQELNDASFNVISKEVASFKALQEWYGKEHEYELSGDFPLLNSQQEKRLWLQRKKRAVERYRTSLEQGFYSQLKVRFKHQKLDLDAWYKSMTLLRQLQEYNKQLKAIYSGWQESLHQLQINKIITHLPNPANAETYITELSVSLKNDFQDLRTLDIILTNSLPESREVIDRLSGLISSDTPSKEIRSLIRDNIYHYWILSIERQYPVLQEVSTRGWKRQALQYGEKLKERNTRLLDLVKRRLMESILSIIEYNRLNNPVTYREIHHQVSKKRRLWSVRKLVYNSWDEGLSTLCPCWMASPESASAIFPMQEGFFDLVIFDEASQCFVEKALPVLLRGKQSLIAGDAQQLQPLDLYKVKYEEEEEAFSEHELALEVESILDLAKAKFPATHLIWHYRSHQSELIQFSNSFFYDGRLQVMPQAKKDLLSQPPIKWIQIAGIWHQNKNLQEAEAIIQQILLLVKREDQPSVGVVTFNFHQQELIKDLLDQKLEELAYKDPDLFRLLDGALNKKEDEEYQGLFVKNIENVQGDERDIIIFSVAYSYDLAGKLKSRFGLLNQHGGENRLNVAISRARRQVFIFCSFDPAMLNVDESINEGPKRFKQYLQFAKAVSEGRDSSIYLPKPNTPQWSYEHSAMSSYLQIEITKAGYHVDKQVGNTLYKLDLAVKKKADDHDYILGIECEGPNYFQGKSSKEREVYRPQLLLLRNWKYHRVWARNFRQDKEGEVRKILEMLEWL